MTIIEEWDAAGAPTLETEEISFSITAGIDTAVGTETIGPETITTESINTESITTESINTGNIGPNEPPIDFVDGSGPAFAITDHGDLEDSEADWELQAACRAVEGSGNLFFSEELTDIVAAKRICADCPVIAPCLEGALHRAEPCGVWGGQLFSNGRVLAQKRRRGRPPKVARPEDQLPVVPVPAHLQKLIA